MILFSINSLKLGIFSIAQYFNLCAKIHIYKHISKYYVQKCIKIGVNESNKEIIIITRYSAC